MRSSELGVVSFAYCELGSQAHRCQDHVKSDIERSIAFANSRIVDNASLSRRKCSDQWWSIFI